MAKTKTDTAQEIKSETETSRGAFRAAMARPHRMKYGVKRYGLGDLTEVVFGDNTSILFTFDLSEAIFETREVKT